MTFISLLFLYSDSSILMREKPNSIETIENEIENDRNKKNKHQLYKYVQ